MAKPTQGQQYITVQSDTLEKLASSAYGNPSKWPLIKNVNKTQIKISSSTEKLPVGLALIIPVDAENNAIRQTQLNNGLK